MQPEAFEPLASIMWLWGYSQYSRGSGGSARYGPRPFTSGFCDVWYLSEGLRETCTRTPHLAFFGWGEYDHRPSSWRPVFTFIIIVGIYTSLDTLYTRQTWLNNPFCGVIQIYCIHRLTNEGHSLYTDVANRSRVHLSPAHSGGGEKKKTTHRSHRLCMVWRCLLVTFHLLPNKRKMPKSCCVVWCTINRVKKPEPSFYKLPNQKAEPLRRQMWIQTWGISRRTEKTVRSWHSVCLCLQQAFFFKL